MIAPFRELLESARASGGAVPAFTVYGLDGAVGVLSAAEDGGRDVVILVSAATLRSRAGAALVAGLRALCEQATVGCALQLDHAPSLELIHAGLDAGVGAVMADASTEPFAANVDFVAAAVALASSYGAAVEAELGRVEGDEEAAAGVLAGALTDPAEAEAFMAATDVDCLAVSIGNVHGHYSGAPTLDLPRLEAIATRVTRPLSLHGASGLPPEIVGAAIARGVCKVNVNTELREAYFSALERGLPEFRAGARLLDLGEHLANAIAAASAAKLDELRGS